MTRTLCTSGTVVTSRGSDLLSYWVSTSSEMLKTTPMKVIIAELIVVTIVLASSTIEIRSRTSSYASSSCRYSTISASSAAPATATAHAADGTHAHDGRIRVRNSPRERYAYPYDNTL